MKILFVGGTFNDEGGKPSSVVNHFVKEIEKYNVQITLYNGGYFSRIKEILNECSEHEVVIWWANIPNDKPKLRDIKSINYKAMLITSKRNDNDKYSFSELINRALSVKANLSIEFKKVDNKSSSYYEMMLFDPLGNCWYKGMDIETCCEVMINKLFFLKNITRQGCVQLSEDVDIPNDTKFFDIIKKYADTFHKLINPSPNITRFLGNSSFRCQRGFPSFRKNGLIYVSKRNIDKRFIDKNGFVPTTLIDESVMYYGENKPSVDTPIQLRLYEKLPNINYMIHSHVYIKDAPFTTHMIPCGGLEEVSEVLSLIQKEYGSMNKDFYAINLLGHGSIIMSSDVKKLQNIDYIGRVMPEIHNT